MEKNVEYLKCPNNSGPKLGNNSIWHLIKKLYKSPTNLLPKWMIYAALRKIPNAQIEDKETVCFEI